jgi:uncharacterized protein
MKRMGLVLTLMLPLACAAQQPARLKALILTGELDTLYHDWRASTPYLRDLLERTGRFEVKVAEQVPGTGAAGLRAYDVLVLNYNGPRWGAETERAVEEFVRGGKGLISLHGVTYGPAYGQVFDSGTKKWSRGSGGWAAYPALIGARWDAANIGHARRHVFEVKWTDRQHPISQGLPAAFTANDELYHKLELLPGTKVLATAMDDAAIGGTGKDEPVVWTAAFGQGRTMHITLGHDLSAMSQPGFRAAFARGTEWAATGKVTLPAEFPLSTRAKDAVRVLAVTGGHTYPTAFYTLFEGWDDVAWTHAGSPREAFGNDLLKRFDVVLLHDMWEDLDAPYRERLQAFVEAGKGVISTHHAIVDYTAWPWWWREVIGGKYFTKEQPGHPASSYKEDVEFVVTPTQAGYSHPVTRDVGPLILEDEGYKGMWHSDKIRVLMETNFELNDKPVVWVGPHASARVIEIQVGHSESTMRHPAYRRLVHNAILWTAGRLK